jgi:hypothetical protein
MLKINITCNCGRSIDLPLFISEFPIGCNICKSNITQLFITNRIAATTQEIWQEDDYYNIAQDFLLMLKKRIKNVYFSFHRNNMKIWNERLAFYIAIVQSYAYSSIREIEISDLTRRCAVYLSVQMYDYVYSVIERHYHESLEESFNPPKEIGSNKWKTYLYDIQGLFDEKYDQHEGLQQTVSLYIKLSLLLQYVKAKFNGITDNLINIFLYEYDYLYRYDLNLDILTFDDRFNDLDLKLALESARYVSHHGGIMLSELFLTPEKSFYYKNNKTFLDEILDLLSHVLKINITDIYYYYIDGNKDTSEDFEKFIEKLKQQVNKKKLLTNRKVRYHRNF